MSEIQSDPNNEASNQNPDAGRASADGTGVGPTPGQTPGAAASSGTSGPVEPPSEPPTPSQMYASAPGAAPSEPTAPQPPAGTPPYPSSQPYGSPPPYASPMLYPPAGGAPSPWSPTGAYPPASPVWQPHPAQPPQSTVGAPGRPRAWKRWAVGGAAGLVLALVAGGVGGFVGYGLANNSSGLQSFVSANGNAPIVDRSSLAAIAAKVQPQVVVIQTGNAEGSGVIITSDGYIVTNNHVVATGNGNTVQVTFNSGKTVSANIVGTDPKTDLAVVKANVTGLVPATWGDSNNVNVGDTVLAVGSPLGLQGSVTAGIVSALHRTIQVGGEQQNPFEAPSAPTTIGDAIQTDAPINPGNSGGALVNTAGQVIGINAAIATGGSGSSGNIGVGFAISSNKAQSVANQLIKGKKVSHPYIGVSAGDGNGGAQIQRVVSGSPAAKAGLQAGDVVTQVNGHNVANSEDLVAAVQDSSVGSQLKLTVTRNGSQQTVTVTVGETP